MRRWRLAAVALLLAGQVQAETVRHQVPRPDGTMIDYALDMPDGAPEGILLLAQGSGCQPTRLNANLRLVRAAFPRHVAVTMEKRGVAPEAAIADGYADCPAAFHAGYTTSGRVADYEAVLAEIGSPLPLVLYGGSEGGLAVAMLAGRVGADAAIVMSSATGMPFGEMVLSTVPPEGQESVRAGFAAARADPQGDALFAGSSHRFWADILDLVAADFMLAATVPFLVIQGGRDVSSPVAAARVTADRFAAAGRCNLLYWELPALDHGMADPQGVSQMAGVARAAAHWATEMAAPAGC